MAKKNSKVLNKYYVYYDNKTGTIFSITNEKSDKYEHGIEVPFDEIEKFLSGEYQFKDYVVGFKKLPNNKTVRGILPATDSTAGFRHNVFEWINDTSNKDAELFVEWDFPNKSWNFLLNSFLKKSIANEILLSKLVFFVTLETDFDFLIRTIFIDIKELLDNDRVSVAFVSNKEHDITKISISSKLVFRSYGLKIINE